MDFHSYAVRDGHGLPHNPLKAIIAPRPIGWMSTLSATGIANLAPYSFFNIINDVPPLVMFASTGHKDSVSNIEATGAFVFNLATRPLAEKMNITSAMFPPDVDEFEAAGLTKAPSLLVAPPRVAESPAALECRAVEVRQLRDMEGAAVDGWLTIGQIVAVHIDRACLVDGIYRTERAHPILRAGYEADYWELTPTGHFTMRRPQ